MTKSLVDILQNHQHEFHPVVPFKPEEDKLLLLDFSAANENLSFELVNNTHDFSEYINGQLNKAGARYGIGGYGEHRTIYQRSHVFTHQNPDEEPRRLHLGVDIWGKPHTAVMAPIDGMVHSFGFNNAFGDYGGTIILTHLLEGTTFYTLYGHLSANSIKNLVECDRINKGDIFAGFGIPADNGSWPPHLHFQVIADLENYKGDYPGVCKFSEKEKYLANCPDPDIILQLNQFL
jgi:murein DD-endopeptidase MepM/ murein hydrolase activator NlpD